MRKMDTSVIRPFSPVYSSIISSSLPESHVEPLFRQLCALHWLLEALTIDYTHHTMKPLIACWNPKDPGGSKSAIRKINKEKSMGQRWDHFVTAPKGGKGCGVSCQADKLLAKLQSQDKGSFLTDTKKLKVPAMRTASRRLSRRGSTLSLSRTSGASSPQSSMLSVNPGSDEPPSVVTGSKDVEDNESSSTKPEEEILHAHLQKLLEMVREDARRAIMMMMQKRAPSILTAVKQVKSDYTWKEWQSTHRHSERSSTTSGESHIQVTPKKPKGRANRDIIQCKSGVCDSMRAKFYSIAQEAGFCLQDKMEILTKRQEERGLQKFQSFILASNFQKDLSKMRHQVPVMKGDAEEIADHWYFDLLSKLPEDLKNFRPAKRVLTKLQKFGENLDLRIRPHVLLKVLQDLRIWELCSPDIAVAIEFVREHIIHMPSNDYVNWLQGRVNMPIQQQAHPT